MEKSKWMVTQVLTERCNLRCRMCFQTNLRKKQNRELPITRILEFYQKHHDNLYAVNITGGEPFLRADCMELLEKLDEMGLIISVNTNGTLFTREIVERIGCLSHLRSINISIDGPKETHEAIRNQQGIFVKIMSNIALLRGKVRANAIQINTMIMPETLPVLDAHLSYLESQGIKRFELIFPGSYSKEELCKSVSVLNESGLSGMTIDTAGEEVFRQLSVENAQFIMQVIKNHPGAIISVTPKTFIKDPALFLDSKLDNYRVECAKLKRKEFRINSSGQIIFCDTFRAVLAEPEKIDSVEDILSNHDFIKLKKAIGQGIPCCKRCCKSTNLVVRK